MLLRLLRTHLAPYKPWLAAIVVLQFTATVAMLYLPSLNADIIDQGVAVGDTDYILHTGAVMLGVSLLQILCSVVAVACAARTAMSFGRDLRAAVFHRVGAFSGREVAQFGAPSLITRNTNDVQQVQMLALLSCSLAVQVPIMMVGGIVMAMREDLGLSWLLAIVVPALFLSVGLVVSQMVPSFRLVQSRIDDVNRILREQISGIRVVRAFVREPRETAAVRRGERRPDRGLGPRRPLDGDDVPAGDARGEHLQRRGDLVRRPPGQRRTDAGRGADRVPQLPDADPDERDDGDLHADADPALGGVRGPHRRGARHPAQRRTSARRRRRARPATASSTSRTSRSPTPAPSSRCSATSASAPGPGQTVAIIGSTGAGKSTLVNLVPRLFDATSGSVRVDGVDVRDARARSCSGRGSGWCRSRRSCSPAPSAATCCTASRTPPTTSSGRRSRSRRPATSSSGCPRGSTPRSSRAAPTSRGGQRQRLAIARALVRRPEIYLFDDAFSALDLATDARLRAALRPETRDATVVVVAQRVSTIRDADLILVLEDGRVVGRGTHAELLESNETYQEIVASQLTAEEAA